MHHVIVCAAGKIVFHRLLLLNKKRVARRSSNRSFLLTNVGVF